MALLTLYLQPRKKQGHQQHTSSEGSNRQRLISGPARSFTGNRLDCLVPSLASIDQRRIRKGVCYLLN
ncbi:hypothetical protein M440DRAFT_1399319 [Trichoderma longibrachiatum ATCC 18648]|uniref:Uncharacterized protein n=1 Tax=Trichoderma longibrachiatum ATCC 18648 TaxID=983965 RepID=A0A2T4C9E1_TRILO|nr:hypothetical protein M440DRAFT_1399319 [Trichoderma longibrachiatum ATCC 18648]